MESLLFSPLTIRGLTLRNRIVLSPMLTYSATNGYTNDTHLAHLAKFAVGGAGLVFVESTKIDPRGCSTPRDLGLWKDEFIPGMRRIVDLVSTGSTLKANGLVEIEHIADISSRFIVNRAALKTRPDEMAGWIERFREATNAA